MEMNDKGSNGMVINGKVQFLIETKKDEIDTVKKLLTQCMENACTLSVPLTAEAKTGRTWYDAH